MNFSITATSTKSRPISSHHKASYTLWAQIVIQRVMQLVSVLQLTLHMVFGVASKKCWIAASKIFLLSSVLPNIINIYLYLFVYLFFISHTL